MRVLILGDMEGVGGVVHWDQIMAGGALYQEGRRLYTEEINAAARGAFMAGAERVVVVDSHGAGAAGNMAGQAFNSLVPELLDERLESVTHHGWGNYTELLEEGCDAVFFVGIHAMDGTEDGVLSHTISTRHFKAVHINGTRVGEIGIIAALSGHFGVPMALVTGDSAACREARELLGPDLRAVSVKHGLSRYSARHVAPARARGMIEEGAREALGSLTQMRPYKVECPVTVTFDIIRPDQMAKYRRIGDLEIEEPLRVHSRGADFPEAWYRVAPYTP